MLSLITDGKPSSEPNFPARWCLDREDLQHLREEKAKFIHVLFVVAYGNGTQDRLLVPLDEYMTYIPLRYPGKHVVHARLVWANESATSEGWSRAERWFLGKYGRNRYEHAVLNSEKDGFDEEYLKYSFHCEESCRTDPQLVAAVGVEVPAEFFPPEPPAWLKRWVNLLFEYNAVDQCQFRRRKYFLAFTLQPFLVALFLVLRPVLGGLFAIVVGVGLGFQGIDLTVLLHPWRTSLDDLYEPRGYKYDPYWKRHRSWYREYADGSPKLFTWWLLNPILWGLGWAALEITARLTGLAYPEILLIVFDGLVKAGIFLWAALFDVLGTFLRVLRDSIVFGMLLAIAALGIVIALYSLGRRMRVQYEARPDIQELLRREREEAERRALEAQERLLICQSVPQAPAAARGHSQEVPNRPPSLPRSQGEGLPSVRRELNPAAAKTSVRPAFEESAGLAF